MHDDDEAMMMMMMMMMIKTTTMMMMTMMMMMMMMFGEQEGRRAAQAHRGRAYARQWVPTGAKSNQMSRVSGTNCTEHAVFFTFDFAESRADLNIAK
eukprot:2745502-Rhodomonas_salina.1